MKAKINKKILEYDDDTVLLAGNDTELPPELISKIYEPGKRFEITVV